MHFESFHYLLYSLPSTDILRTLLSGQLPVGLIAQLIEHCTGIAEVMSSNAIQA